MGGGDLNTKKSWHPSTFKNQERVWKAEQADAAEKRKLAELQHEINEERNREELKSIAKKSGLIPDDGQGDRKLEWMYRQAPAVNREEYLLGRTVDKNFEMLDAQEKAAASASGSGSSAVGISQPKNHVEHECIPFSIRQYKGLEGTEQVDMARKLMEDPLMAIKQKEVESRQKILENPVKLKELHRLLKSDQSIRGKGKERDRERDRKGDKKKDKKDKKKKSKKKRKGSDSSGSSNDSEEEDLDKLLAEKYKKVQNTMEKQEEVSLDKLLSMKYQKLSKELNKLAKPNKSKKKKDRRKSGSSEDSELDSDSDGREPTKRRRDSRERQRPGPSKVRERSRSDDRRDRQRRNRPESPKRRDNRSRSPENRKRMDDRSKSPEIRRRRDDRPKSPENRRRKDDRVKSPENHRRRKDRSESPENRRRKDDRSKSPKRREDRKRSRSPARRSPKPSRELAPRGRRTPVPSSSSSAESSPEHQPPRRKNDSDDDDDDRRPKAKNFGLVSASGKKLELNKRDEVRLYKKEEIKAHQSSQKPTWTRPERKAPLTEEEMEAKRKAMMSNAEWRDKERQKNVKRYEDEEKKLEERDGQKKYDKEFVMKQFKHAANNETVEKRIKSNRNNIQRSGGAMNDNFARR